MKKQFIYAAVLIAGFLGFTSNSFGQFNAEISIGDRGLRSFYLSVGNYYNVPQREVVIIHERRIPAEEVPVVFYIARHAHVSPVEVAAYRKRGCSWIEVSRHYGLGPDIYGHSYPGGYYKHKKHRNKNVVYISDGEIINYVNTRVMCDSYGCSRDDVYRMRNQGYGYVNINDRYYNERHGRGRDDRHDVKIKVKEKHNHGRGHGKWDRHDD